MRHRRLASLVIGAAIAAGARGDVRILPQRETFDVAQDRRGVVYVAGAKGVLTYDGAWWSTIALPKRAPALAVESDDAGVVAAGGRGELGFLAGSRYRSLLAQLPAPQRDVGEVRGICTSERGFIFAGTRSVIEWNGGAPRIIGELAGPARCGRIGDAVILWNLDGLHRIEGQRIVNAGLQGRAVESAVETSGGNVLAAIRNEGLFVVDRAGNATRVSSEEHITDLAKAGDGFAAATSDGRVLLLDGNYATRNTIATGSAITSLFVDADGALWLASEQGPLMRIALRAATPRTPMIRNAAAAMAPLAHDFGRLRIEFAPLTYDDSIGYQYRLDPIDSAWSDWAAEPFIDYTRLGGGHYTFRLRTRDAHGKISDGASWTFTVLPPWYRKPLPVTLFAILAAALILWIVKLRTRALRRQADRLRALIAERTQELSEANQHLERLALLDDLTGIPNRRYFDRALARAWEIARERQTSLSVILLDLDHFKNLNDEYGHAAGDESLLHLGRLLAQKIRRSGEFASRSGDVVARIGGEEFAVLLAATDADGAMKTAETLRAAIEELDVSFDGKRMQLSVSCGVATMVPTANESAEVLVRRADTALYAAKAAGRNCVRVAA